MNSTKVKMKEIHCIVCDIYRNFKNPNISNIFKKTLVLPIICSKCGNKDEKIFKEEESTEMLTTLGFNTKLPKR